MFRLKLFGSPSLEGPEGRVEGRATQRHRLGLLAILALATDRGVARERVSGLLWPDAGPDQGRRLLSDSVYRVNQAVGGEGVRTEGESLRLDPDRIDSDVARFRAALARGDLREAVAVHAAPFLEGFGIPGAVEFDRWVDAERQRLTRELGQALEGLAEGAADDPASAAIWWRQRGALDPYSSRVALRIMESLAAAGDRAAAVQHAAMHSTLVREDLGLEPDPEVARLVAALRIAPASPVQEGPAPEERPGTEGVRTDPDAPDRPSAGGETRDAPAPARAEPPAPIAERAPAARSPLRGVAPVLALLAVGAAVAVWWSGRSAPAPVGPTSIEARLPLSLVVLPLSDLSPDPEGEWFADGLTDEIITRLSTVPGLRVIGRTTSFAFKGRGVDARALGAQLGVDAVLDGSVRREGGRLRIAVQLIDATDGFQLWAETYERAEADAFALQDQIARATVARLVGSAIAPPAAPPPEADPTAYNAYLAGRFEWHRRTQPSLLAAVDHFERAVALAPTYARAHAGLGDARAVLGFYDYLPPSEAFPSAAASAQRALALDPDLPEPWATLGYVALYHEWDGAAAERAFQRSIELGPGYSTAHQWYANLLYAQGRFGEAEREMRIAQELDPLSLIANSALGWVLYYAGEHERALAQLASVAELDPDFELVYLWRGMVLEELGRTAASLEALRLATKRSPTGIARAALARGLAKAGRRAEAQTLLADLEAEHARGYAPTFEIAKVYEALGQPEEALRWLERAYDERSHSLVFLEVDPQLVGLRSHPRFRTLVERVGFAGSGADGGPP
ncbi:MAG: tetratricopeptide repeat protein [Gemmatimonadetes bacterium]|nr:tetratricopeptide repeat protein [Gemmatimonadota bacterium]